MFTIRIEGIQVADINDALVSGSTEEVRAALAQREADRKKLHKEIAAQDQQMIHGVFLLAFCMIGSFVAAEITLNVVLFKLVMALAVTTTFWIARGDYMIHRAAAYVETIETKYSGGWESHKKSLMSVRFMIIVDLFAGAGLFWMLYETSERLAQLGATDWVWKGWIGVAAGISLTGLMVLLARKRW